MLAEYRRKTNIGIGIAIFLQITALFIYTDHTVGAILSLLFITIGNILFIWGCWSYAKGKGYHGAWGFLGLLSIIGLIILIFFPDRNKFLHREQVQN